MLDQAEIDRLDRGVGLSGTAPAAGWRLEFALDRDAAARMGDVLYVVRTIAACNQSEWPDDEGWLKLLPKWIIGAMPELTREEAESLLARTPRERWSTLPWTLGSWLDAMRERGWRWWGYELSETKLVVVVSVLSIPPQTEALKQLCIAAGARAIVDGPV